MRFFFSFLFFSFPILSYSQIENEYKIYTDSSCYDVKSYIIDISASNDSLYLVGKAEIIATATQRDLNVFYIELNDALNVDSVLINGYPVTFTHENIWVKANTKTPVPQGSVFNVIVFYEGYPATRSIIGGITLDSYYDNKVLYTLSEPFSSLDFFACKQFLTDKADSVTITLNVPRGLKGIANGLLVSTTDLPGNMVSYCWKSQYPVAYYLIAIAIANYKEYSYKYFDEYCNDSVLFQNFYYNTPDYLAENINSINETIKIIKLFEKTTGVAYPFHKEKYGYVTAPIGGGMENQTITMIDEFSFNLVAHELAHSWFGDMVTCVDWQNIWVNEGFASYFEYYANEVFYPDYSNIWMSRCFSNAIRNPETSVYVPDEDKRNERRIFSYYESYRKGATIIHMLRRKINNDSTFFKVLNVYLNQYAFSNASADDFKAVAENVTSLKLDTFFNQWFYGKGYPIIDIDGEAKNRRLSLSIKQASSAADNNFTEIVLEVKLKFKSKPDTFIQLDVSKKMQKFDFRFGDVVTELIINPHYYLLGSFNSNIKIDSTDSFTKVVVAPNPFTNHIYIDFPDTGKIKSARLYDINGKSIFEWNSPDTYMELFLSNINAGPYLLLTDDGNTSSKIKVIKTY